jgi:hypothetical protein
MFKKLSIDGSGGGPSPGPGDGGMSTISGDDVTSISGPPMFDEQPRPEPAQGAPLQGPAPPMMPGAAPPADPSTPPVGQSSGLPAISDLNL